MKKFLKMINNNKLLFTIFIIIVFVIFDFLTNGIGLWSGLVSKLVNIFDNIFNHTYYGSEFVGEFFWFLLLIPILIIFKSKDNKNKKKENLFKSLLMGWPILVYAVISFIRSLLQINIDYINVYEVIALILLTLTVGLFEELLCRGWIQNEFMKRFGKNRKGVIFSIIMSGSIFGLMHITNIFFGQSVFTTISQIIYAIIVGISFGTIYYRTKNIWSVVILHSLWDFTVLFSEINVATTCASITSSLNAVTPVLGVLAIISGIFSSLPELAISFMYLGKNEVNIALENPQELTLEEVEQSKKNKLIFSIFTMVFLLLYGIIVIAFGSMKSNTCPVYKDMNPKNYGETIYNYTNYDLLITKSINYDECSDNQCNTLIKDVSYKYNFNIDNNKLVLTNKLNNKEYVFDYDKVKSFIVFEANNKYNVIILSVINGDIITYYSNFINEDNISDNEEYILEFMNSFEQVMVPSIINKVGYFEENNQKYPLFITWTNDAYVLYPDGTIYKYKQSN